MLRRICQVAIYLLFGSVFRRIYLPRTTVNKGKRGKPEQRKPRLGKQPIIYRLASQVDGLGGAEYPSRSVFGSHDEVRLGGTHQHGRFESVPADRPYRM